MSLPFVRRPKTARVWAGAAAVSALALGAAAMNLAAKPAISPAAVAADPQVQKIAAANTDFGFRLLKQLAHETPTQNVFYSPFSVTSALTLTLNGAGGATHTAMADALRLPPMTADQTDHAYGLLLPSLEDPDPQVTLTVANALWAIGDTKFNPRFQQQSERFFGARVQTLDRGASAATTINGWVSEKTHGKIDKLVTPAEISASPAVLTNAVYFHGRWSRAFDKSDTQDGPFTLASGKTKTVPLMSQEARFSYAEMPKFQAISLPYGNDERLSLYVLLPKSGVTAASLVNGLDPASWNETLGKMKRAQVNLTLPRFRANFQATLNQPLIALGMGRAFGSEADFSPMGLRGGFIGAVIHKAVLEVDEEGTVAAAATGVVMTRSAIQRPEEPVVMRVDHPFVCLLRDNTTGTLLFAGIIQNPE